ncbi:MAG: hypothetical protein DHS20C14_18830 [Phycisphaeraceae bacterium]|nr:MAG: hypothetical protein DHS20C14_18830 [Phycisphaeraceae bacterium]
MLLAIAGAPASAQNAMGDGRALDNNLSPNTQYNAPRADFTQEIRFRNAIATGNAPGGVSFRGDVGYAAPYEFRGELGSDDLFAFRRDSLYSGLAGMGIRGTEAVQYQFALTTGARLPQNVVGSLTVSRDQGGYVSPRAPEGLGQRPQFAPTIGRPSDAEGVDLSAPGFSDTSATNQLRSTSAYTTNRGYTPFLLRTLPAQDGGQDIALTATALRGLKATKMFDPATLYAGAGVEEDPNAEPRAGVEGSGFAGSGPQVNRPDSTYDEAARLEPTRPVTAYEEVLRRVRARAEAAGLAEAPEDPAQRPEWEQRLYDIRNQVMSGTEPDAPADPVPGTEVPLPREIDIENPSGEDAPREPLATDVRFDPATMDLIRETGEPVQHLVDPNAENVDVYVHHVREGERLLAEGKYFDAEERFTRALSARPGDVTSQIGRVHAQIGAGMFLSASLNLRTVFIGSPGAVGTRYAESLLPGPERLGTLMTVLRENIGLAERPGGRLALDPAVQRDSALLLAYLGYQTGDDEALTQGLADFKRRVAPSQDRPGASVDWRMAALLEGVWVRGDRSGRDAVEE